MSVNVGPKGPEVTTHIVVRRPQCAACGASDAAGKATRIDLRPSPVVDGVHRSEAAETTLQRLSHHISPITGVVTWLADSTAGSEGLVHCYRAGHNFAMGPDTAIWLRHALRSRTGGKGATAAQARASAVCEAVERYNGVFRNDVFRIRGTYEELADRAVHPYRCLNFSSQQYDHRDELNAGARGDYLNLIPRRFPENLAIDWVPLWSLTAEEIRYLPAALCYYAHPDAEQHFYCSGDSNGCAAGNVLEEAILAGFLELVERDSAAIWWYNRLERPAIDLDSVSDPYLARVRDHYERHGRELWAMDLTSDIGIPVIVAVSPRIDGPTDDLLFGLGAHLDASVALRQAVIEVNQFLPAVSRRTFDGRTVYAWPDDLAKRFWKNETLASQPQLVPDRAAPRRALSDFPRLTGGDLYDSLQTCLEICRRLRLEMMVLDQSRPDIELSVVRVVVPGLRHFWRRLGPGRLYDVPVQLGWLTTSYAENDLNPTSIFF